MSKYVPFETPGGVVWMEVDEAIMDTPQLAALENIAFESFQDAASALKANAQFLQSMLNELAPSNIVISFGIKAGVEDNVRIFGLAKNSEEAHYSVKLQWEESAD